MALAYKKARVKILLSYYDPAHNSGQSFAKPNLCTYFDFSWSINPSLIPKEMPLLSCLLHCLTSHSLQYPTKQPCVPRLLNIAVSRISRRSGHGTSYLQSKLCSSSTVDFGCPPSASGCSSSCLFVWCLLQEQP